MSKRPDVLLETALLALRRVPRFLQRRTLDDYLNDDFCQSAVERQLDAALFARIPEGDLIVAFRNVLVHGYAALDQERVYDIATRRAGELLRLLEAMLAEIPEGE